MTTSTRWSFRFSTNSKPSPDEPSASTMTRTFTPRLVQRMSASANARPVRSFAQMYVSRWTSRSARLIASSIRPKAFAPSTNRVKVWPGM